MAEPTELEVSWADRNIRDSSGMVAVLTLPFFILLPHSEVNCQRVSEDLDVSVSASCL